MKKLVFILLLLASFGLRAQSTETDIKSLIDALRTTTLTPARVSNVFDAINISKVSIVGTYTATGTDTYSVTAGIGITNNDPNKQILVKFTNANTSSMVTLNVNGNGALPLKTNLNANPDVGGIPAGSIYLIASTGTTWRMIGPTNAGGTVATNWGDIPTGNLQDQTDLYDTLNTKWRTLSKIKTVSSNYTASLGDQNNKVIVVNGGADFKIPKYADVPFPLGSNLLVVDSLGTATFSKDPAVHIDTLDQAQVYQNVGTDKWVTYKVGSGSGNGIVESVVSGTAMTVDDTDPANPVVNFGGAMSADVLINGPYSFQVQGTDVNSNVIFETNTGVGGNQAVMQVGNGNGSGEYASMNTQLEASGVTYSALVSVENESSFNRILSQIAADDNSFGNGIDIKRDGITINASSASGNSSIFLKSNGVLEFDHTNTTAGTTGNQTINKVSGTVNFAAGASSLTVTNSLCTTSSIVFAVVRTNDTTSLIKNVTPGSGSFVIRLNAAATAETSIGFWIIN